MLLLLHGRSARLCSVAAAFTVVSNNWESKLQSAQSTRKPFQLPHPWDSTPDINNLREGKLSFAQFLVQSIIVGWDREGRAWQSCAVYMTAREQKYGHASWFFFFPLSPVISHGPLANHMEPHKCSRSFFPDEYSLRTFSGTLDVVCDFLKVLSINEVCCQK